jgi:hypothetical protein
MNHIAKILRTVLPLAFLALATRSQAQVGIYGTLSASHVDNPSTPQSISFGGTNTDYWTTGGGVGIYYDAYHLGPLSLGLDLRASRAKQVKTGLGGVRVAIHPPILPLKPYVEGLVGGTNSTNIYNADNTNFVYQIVGGLDYTLVPHIDFRAIEIGYGKISTGITTASTPRSTLLTVQTGIAIHF